MSASWVLEEDPLWDEGVTAGRRFYAEHGRKPLRREIEAMLEEIPGTGSWGVDSIVVDAILEGVALESRE